MSDLKVSVIIRCYNEEKHIGKLLSGLEKQKNVAHEVIIVDSGSIDDTLQIVKRFPCRIVNIKPQDFSFGRALNLGCSQAKGEIFVFASAHVYPVYDDWLECLIRPFANAKVAAVYGKQRGNEATKYSEGQIFATWFGEQSVAEQNHPFCNNANCAVRASAWKALPYNEELTGLEDIDWGKRAQEKGQAISYAADAEIIHVHEEKPKQVMNRYKREAIALKRIYPAQGMSIVSFLRLFIVNTITDYFHAIRDGVFFKNLFEIPVFRLMQFWGAYKGFRASALNSELKKTLYYPRALVRAEHSGHERPTRKKIEYGAT